MWPIWLCLICATFVTYYAKSFRLMLKLIVFNLHFALFHFSFLVVIVIWPFPILRGRNVKNLTTWARLLKHVTVLLGVKWEIRNSDVLAKEHGAVIVANHQSTLDIIGICQVVEIAQKMAIVVKKSILYAGALGVMSYFGGMVYIDRNNQKSSYKQLEETAHVLMKKIKIWIFPEGTRNYDQTKLLSFKKGAFMMAVAAQAPIIPVVYSPYYFIDRKSYTFSKGRAIIQCLEEVQTVGLTMDDVPELTERVHGMMLAAYKKLSEEVIPYTTNFDY